MKDNVKIIKQDIDYERASNNYRSKYSIYDAGYGKVSCDNYSETKWAEKYRPKILDDLILPKKIHDRIKKMAESKTLEDILLYSPNGGTGKDSIVQVIKNELDADMLSINASKDRSIDTIRTKVVQFSSTLSAFGDKKIVNMGETGGLTAVAVDSLKGVMEEFSTNVSWLFTTNSLKNIPEALLTRFGEPISMNIIPKDEKPELAKKLFFRLKTILDIEDVEYNDKDIMVLISKHFPSYRKLMVILESSVIDGKLQPQEEIDSSEASNILKMINEGNYLELVKISESIQLINFMNYMNSNYYNMIDVKMIPSFIEAFNGLQIAVSENHMFTNISFLVFCNKLMLQKIQFKM